MNPTNTTLRRSLRGSAAFAMATCTCLCSCAIAREPVSLDGHPLLADMRQKAPGLSLTVLPVRMLEKPQRDIGDVVGLMLEKDASMPNVYSTQLSFDPPASAEFADVRKLLGKWISENKFETEYVLYAEIAGTPQTGPTEIRTVIAQSTGEIVWSDAQTPKSPTFKSIRPTCPMECCQVIAERVQASLELPHPGAKPIEHGRMMQLWEQKSGTPDDSDRESIEARTKTLARTHRDSTLLVFPPQVNGEPDAASSAKLQELVDARGFEHVVASTAEPRFEIAPSRNEQKQLWDLARSFRAYVQENPPDEDYTLYAEYRLNPKGKGAHAVHFIVCDRAGNWVIVDFQNDHHPDFQTIAPKTNDDCAALVARRIRHYLK